MKKAKQLFKKLLFPHQLVIIICCAAAGALLWYVFSSGTENALAYITYFFSAYSFCVLLIRLIPLTVRKVYALLCKIPVMNRYLNDIHFRAHTAIYLSLIGNGAYSVFYFVMAFVQKSYWQAALAIYNMVFTLMRFMLALNYSRARKKGCEKEQLLYEWKAYRLCGALMLLMSATMTGIIELSIENGKNTGGDILTITIATYTFYCFIIAIINVVKFKKENSPILLASKNVCFARALMTLFSLQITMFSQYDTTGSEMQHIMDIVLGLAVCALCVGIALTMLIKSNKNIKNTK